MKTSSLFAAILPMLAFSCAPVGDADFVGKTSQTAKDHIMLVREDPPSFGFQRLRALSNIHPDLGIFLEAKRLPDFMAETQKDKNRYLILYYLQKRQAFAVRTIQSRPRPVEFSGPYPITDKENRILGELKKRAPQAPRP